jgi:hypothetical protein
MPRKPALSITQIHFIPFSAFQIFLPKGIVHGQRLRFLYIYIPSAGVASRILCTNTLQRTPTMASSTPDAAAFEEVCREIHEACGQPRLLGLLLAPRSPSERQQIRVTYRATFCKDLAGTLQRIVADNQENQVKSTVVASAYLYRLSQLSRLIKPSQGSFQLCKLLYLWTLEPADRDAVMAREAVEDGMTVAGYRTLVEVFTRRKQNQLFFTKQAYMARFRRNLEQDMVAEPSHPYQRARNSASQHSSPVLYCHMVFTKGNQLPSDIIVS